MRLDGADPYDELVGDGTIGFALGHEPCHLSLTRSQPTEFLLQRTPWRKRGNGGEEASSTFGDCASVGNAPFVSRA